MDRPGGPRVAAAVILLLFAFSAAAAFAGWCYTSSQLALARSHGVYPTAEEGMRELVERGYVGISRVDILYAGPNSFNGSQPHVWYVVAEVRGWRRADGSELGDRGCDAPGSFFIQTKEGWVHVSEGALPELVGLWMSVFGLAGPGQSTPSINLAPSPPARFCQSA